MDGIEEPSDETGSERSVEPHHAPGSRGPSSPTSGEALDGHANPTPSPQMNPPANVYDADGDPSFEPYAQESPHARSGQFAGRTSLTARTPVVARNRQPVEASVEPHHAPA